MYRIRWSEQYFSDCPVPRRGVASHAGVFRGARISSLGSSYFFPPQGRNTSSPKNACVGGYIQDCCFMLWQKFLRKITLNKNLFNILDSVNRNDDKLLRTQVETVKPRAMDFLGKSRTRGRRHHCVISLFHTALMDHSSWPISLTLSSKSCTCVKESYSSN